MSIKGVEIRELKVLGDERGNFFEFLRKEYANLSDFGQIYITTAYPGKAKGNHYHKRKIEWFCVIKGDGELVLKDKNSGEQEIIKMGDSNKVVVKIPANVLHAIKNVGQDTLYLLAYISEPYNEEDPDTYKEELI